MDHHRRKSCKRADLEGHAITQKPRRNGDAFKTQSPKIFPAVREMRPNEKEKQGHPNQAVFSEKLDIIVVNISDVPLHALGPELASIVDEGFAPCPDYWLQFPLLDSRFPEVQAHILAFKCLLGAV